MNDRSPIQQHSYQEAPHRVRGASNLLTVIVVVLVAALGVLLVVNPSPKSVIDPQAERSDASEQSDQIDNQPAQATDPQPEPTQATQDPVQPPAQLPDQHPIELDRSEVDFGYVLVGDTVVEQVVMYNASDATLRVAAIHTACPCTEAEVSPRTIGPRSSAVLELTYTAQSFPHVAPLRSVRVQLREYPRQMITVTMRAAVGREIRLNADRSPIIKEMAGEVLVESYDGQPFSVLMVDGREPDFVDFDPETDDPRSSYLVRYDFSSRPGGGAPRQLHIVTDRESDPLAEIITRMPGNFREALNSQPVSWLAENRIVQVGTLSEASPKSRRTVLLKRTRTEGTPELEAALQPATGNSTIGISSLLETRESPAVSVEIVQIEPGTKSDGDYYVTLEFVLQPGTPSGLHNDILTLLTPDGNYTELDVVTHAVSQP